MRRMLTTVAVSIGFIALSVVVTLIASDFQQRMRDEGGEQDCPADWKSFATNEKEELVRDDRGILHCYCDEIPLSQQVNDHLCRVSTRAKSELFGVQKKKTNKQTVIVGMGW
jgi:hypothetical protein